MSIHLSSGGGTLRRGCSVATWRDVRSNWSRRLPSGGAVTPMPGPGLVITRSAGRVTRSAKPTIVPSTPSSARPRRAGLVAPRPTATVRDGAGNPLNRDEYAVRLRAQLTEAGRSTGHALLTTPQAAVVAGLLDEMAGVYRGESLGVLAHELSVLLHNQVDEQA